MKLKDLKVGEEYAAGSKRYLDRVTLLSVGGWVPYNSSGFTSAAKAAHEKTGAFGCRVRQSSGTLDVVLPAQIHRTWAEHEAIQSRGKAARLKAATEGSARASRAASLAKRIDLLLSDRWGGPLAHSYLNFSDSPDRRDAYLDGISELVALAERAGRGEG